MKSISAKYIPNSYPIASLTFAKSILKSQYRNSVQNKLDITINKFDNLLISLLEYLSLISFLDIL